MSREDVRCKIATLKPPSVRRIPKGIPFTGGGEDGQELRWLSLLCDSSPDLGKTNPVTAIAVKGARVKSCPGSPASVARTYATGSPPVMRQDVSCLGRF